MMQPWSHLFTNSGSHKDEHTWTHKEVHVHYGGENRGMEYMLDLWLCRAEGLSS